MRISELVAELQRLWREHGDLDVKWQSMDHAWPVEPKVASAASGKIVLVNP